MCVFLLVYPLIFFFVDNSDDNAASIQQRSHTKSLFIGMIHQILNLRYSRQD